MVKPQKKAYISVQVLLLLLSYPLLFFPYGCLRLQCMLLKPNKTKLGVPGN